jgi:hypothetical protein
MRVATNTDNRELSLEAMRHAFRASNFVAQKPVATGTGVVHALLKGNFDDGAISPFWLVLAATPPTLVALAAFQLFPG